MYPKWSVKFVVELYSTVELNNLIVTIKSTVLLDNNQQYMIKHIANILEMIKIISTSLVMLVTLISGFHIEIT